MRRRRRSIRAGTHDERGSRRLSAISELEHLQEGFDVKVVTITAIVLAAALGAAGDAAAQDGADRRMVGSITGRGTMGGGMAAMMDAARGVTVEDETPSEAER